MKTNTKKWNNKQTRKLFEAVLLLETPEEVASFFRDLMTWQEIKAFGERFQVAKLLKKGMSYREIAKETGVSTTTITRVNEWLENGMGGYELILDRLQNSSVSSSHSSKHPR
jgi:TrpR-related protein YerC/YecD